jgi:hypothetical protein
VVVFPTGKRIRNWPWLVVPWVWVSGLDVVGIDIICMFDDW